MKRQLMTFCLSTCITHRCIGDLLEAAEIILVNHSLNNGKKCVPHPMMPPLKRRLGGNKDMLIRRPGRPGYHRKGVKPVPTSSLKKKVLHVPILKEKIPWVKFEKGIVFISKFVGRDNIFGGTWNM
jgi:hypothetical protein